jgi:type VI protein secretion system component VasK
MDFAILISITLRSQFLKFKKDRKAAKPHCQSGSLFCACGLLIFLRLSFTEEKQMADNQQQEIEQLQRKVSELQGELKTELKQSRTLDAESHVGTDLDILFQICVSLKTVIPKITLGKSIALSNLTLAIR